MNTVATDIAKTDLNVNAININTINIDPEYEKLIEKESSKEYEKLKESIKHDGLYFAIDCKSKLYHIRWTS